MTADAVIDLVMDETEKAGGDAGLRPVAPALDTAAERLPAFLAEEDWGRALAIWFRHAGPLAGAPAKGRILAALDREIAEIDALLTEQTNAIIHHRRFQALEAGWRGLRYLVAAADEVDNVLVRVLHLSWAECCRDLERAIEFDQSQLFAKIYSEEFGMPGGRPYGILVGNYEVQHRRSAEHPTDDVAALKAAAQVAAAAFSPLVVGASPVMLGLDGFRDLAQPIDLPGTFRHPDYARWKSFQESDDARFVGITLPRILLRLPYRDDGSRIDGFRFAEETEGPEDRHHLWGCAAFAFASIVIRAFGASGWFTDIRGARRDSGGSGLVADLPVPWFDTDRPGLAIRYSTDVALSERQEKELGDLGFIPLLKAKDTPFSIFYGNQSAQAAKRYDSAAATMNARLSTMLQYILCVARFAHYVKVLARERVGSFVTPEECETFLQKWLHAYVNSNEGGGAEMLARYPLREGRVLVREPPGRPGTYQCTIHLKPHFQLDQVISEFKLVTELAPRQAA
jgi:type VI secretion system protein ImpD